MQAELMSDLKINQVVKVNSQLALSTGVWGIPRTNQEIVKRFSQGKTEDEKTDMAKAIEATGFDIRYHPRIQGFADHKEELSKLMVDGGEAIIKQTLQANGWEDGIDLLILSTSAYPGQGKDIDEELRVRTNSEQTMRSFMACNGVNGAVFEILNREEYKDKRVAILSFEPLGHTLRDTYFLNSAIFGNGMSCVAFKSGAFTLYRGVTQIFYDQEQLIRLQPTYEISADKGVIPLPDWYQVIKPEWYQQDRSDEHFHYSSQGMIAKMPMTQNGEDWDSIHMNGADTGLAFARTVGPSAFSLIQSFQKEYGYSLSRIIAHLPSRVIFDSFNKRFDRINKKLSKAGEDTVEIPVNDWTAQEGGFCNTSSSTFVFNLETLLKCHPRNTIVGVPVLFCTYGEGVQITVWTGMINLC